MKNSTSPKRYLANTIASLVFVCFGFNTKLVGQTAPDFGAASAFVLFSGAGAVSSTGISTVTGNVGSNAGAITGFGVPTILDGTIENVNPITLQAALDLTAACVQLQNTAATITNHSTIYGNGETLVPGVYSAGAAASILGTLKLDAQGDPNALFIFKIGGALTTAAGTTVTLVNGALASNVFWIANGAIAMAAGTTMVGKVIGYDGAVSMGAGCVLDGSLYANAGAVSIYGTIATVAAAEILIPTVTSQSTTNTSPTISGTWGGAMLGDDTLTVTVNGIAYSEEIYINNENWSLTIYYPELVPGTYEVVATTNRTSNNKTSTDATNSELVILDTADPTTVTSANDGGLESNGDLASLIANRNFNRIKTNSFVNKKEAQKKFTPNSIFAKTVGSNFDFSTVIPITGMYGTETTFVSSPTDLIGITNAEQVYSVDYYQGENRIAAVLATATSGSIYGHSKAICDRLNDSSLEDVTTINLNGYEIILVKIKRSNGLIEYAMNFSVQRLGSVNMLHSYWNIEQYPSGDYLNFQVWGSSTGQVCNIANSIVSKFKQVATLSKTIVENRIPTVFVKKGNYSNGQLYLTIINKTRALNLTFQGNKKVTEVAVSDYVSQNISLTGSYEQNVQLDLGGLFDIGFSIIGNTSKQLDALYLADGPWGLDYLKNEVTITSYDIDNDVNDAIITDGYNIERNTSVTGEIYGTLNVFRNVLPGELAFDASSYSALGFAIQNSLPVEVILVTENTSDWNNRLRFQIPANTNLTEINILFDKFTSPQGHKYSNEKIKGIVFSVQGNYVISQAFTVAISKLAFKNASTLSNASFVNTVAKNMYNYPNPCVQTTTIVLPKVTESANVRIVDMIGRTVSVKSFNSIPYNNELAIGLDNLKKGVYFFIVTTQDNEQFQNKFIIE
jgi:hypothetical protein